MLILDNSYIYANIDKVKATKIFHQKTVYIATKKGESYRVSVIQEIFKIPEARAHEFPDGFKLSFIAYRSDEPDYRVLLDCHPPKGPHYHIKDKEYSFEWKNIDHAEELFWQLVNNQFGEIEEESK